MHFSCAALAVSAAVFASAVPALGQATCKLKLALRMQAAAIGIMALTAKHGKPSEERTRGLECTASAMKLSVPNLWREARSLVQLLQEVLTET